MPQSPAEFLVAPHDGYRVDKIILVEPPSEVEEAQGITQVDKIRHAFADEVRQWAISQQADQPDVRLEGFAGWFGHGLFAEDLGPRDDDNRRFWEGSRAFRFVTDHRDGDSRGPECIEETEIKDLEHQAIGPFFEYFVQYVSACHSGALIA